MNSVDIFVILVLAVFSLIGIYYGFVCTVVKMAAAFVSTAISMVGYPIAAALARNTFLYDLIKDSVIEKLNLKQMVIDGTRQGQNVIIDSLELPQPVKERLAVNNNSVVYDILAVDNVVDYIGGFLANIILNILMSILLFITCYVIINLILAASKAVRKTPVIRTIGRVGGGLSGFVTGVLFVWALFAIVDAMVAQEFFAHLYDDIQSSSIAVYFYDLNLIRNLMTARMF